MPVKLQYVAYFHFNYKHFNFFLKTSFVIQILNYYFSLNNIFKFENFSKKRRGTDDLRKSGPNHTRTSSGILHNSITWLSLCDIRKRVQSMRKYQQYFLIMLRFITPEILCQCHFQKLEFALLSYLYYIKYSIHTFALFVQPLCTSISLKVE